MPHELLQNEAQFINDAAAYLENPSFLLRLADTLGKPLALLTQGIEKVSPDIVKNAIDIALRTAMTVAIRTMPAGASGNDITIGDNIGDVGSNAGFWHTLSVGVTGTAGGFFGVAGIPIELPITTTIMFRSIASIAKEFGEDIGDPTVRFQCMGVFCLGGTAKGDDEMDSAYLTARAAFEVAVAAAARFVAGMSAEELAAAIQRGTAPLLVNLIGRIAARFNVTVTEKFVAQSLPVAGAVGGATINVAFMDHFNRVARFHFGIRSLERKYGSEFVQSVYREAVRRAKGEKG